MYRIDLINVFFKRLLSKCVFEKIRLPLFLQLSKYIYDLQVQKQRVLLTIAAIATRSNWPLAALEQMDVHGR